LALLIESLGMEVVFSTRLENVSPRLLVPFDHHPDADRKAARGESRELSTIERLQLIAMRHQGMSFSKIAHMLNRNEFFLACEYGKLVPLPDDPPSYASLHYDDVAPLEIGSDNIMMHPAVLNQIDMSSGPIIKLEWYTTDQWLNPGIYASALGGRGRGHKDVVALTYGQQGRTAEAAALQEEVLQKSRRQDGS
jgi:hypothetical protein